MDKNLKISVIIPVYNSEKYIEKCLNSIVNQSYKNYEIIAINDGSTDNSGKILRDFKNKYPDKIKYIEQENMGVAETRNNGIKLADGDYIAFIDNDDFIDEDYLQVLIENATEGFYDVVFCGYRRPNEEGKIIKEFHVSNYKWGRFPVMAPWAKIYKRDYIVKNNFKFLDNNIGEDVYFNLQAMLLTDNIKAVDYIGYNWYFNTQSISNSKQKNFHEINIFNLLNSCISVLNERNILQNNYIYLELFFYRYIIWFLLFTCKGHSYKEISKLYDELFSWLKENFPNYKKNKLIGINKPDGETKGYQLLYLFFMFFHKLKMAKFVVFLYGKVAN